MLDIRPIKDPVGDTWLKLPSIYSGRGIPSKSHTITGPLDLLIAKSACVYSLQHHLSEGHMVAQINISESSVIQWLFFDEVSGSHVKGRLWRGGHPCLKVTVS